VVESVTEPAAQIENEYLTQAPTYEAFTKTATELVKQILNEEGIEIASIDCRTKSLDSLRGKLERTTKSGKYKSLSDITDLSGIRIIAYLKEDCTKIIEIMRQAFSVDEMNSVSKDEELDADRFGYQSIHLILSYDDERLRLREFKRFSGMKFELQVKTLLQHTWSAIDWKLRYKNSHEAPKKLRRRLFRISALLDAADDELSNVYSLVSNIKEYYRITLRAGDMSLEVDRDSLDVYLTESRRGSQQVAEIKKKLNPAPDVSNEEAVKRASETCLLFLSTANITDIKSVDDILSEFRGDKIERINAIIAKWLETVNIKAWSSCAHDYVKFALVMCTDIEIAKKLLDLGNFKPELAAAMRDSLGIPSEA